ncbi:hypothetical protein HOY82DRAFT_243388 [Tuber indicum]|nr:hypothetical protein HOY82DRAFT_243388 [Tuber indicum]
MINRGAVRAGSGSELGGYKNGKTDMNFYSIACNFPIHPSICPSTCLFCPLILLVYLFAFAYLLTPCVFWCVGASLVVTRGKYSPDGFTLAGVWLLVMRCCSLFMYGGEGDKARRYRIIRSCLPVLLVWSDLT